MELKDAVELYENYIDRARLDNFGGYPAIVEIEKIPGYVVIASTIDGNNEPDLEIYTVEEFIENMEALHATWRDNNGSTQNL